MTPRQIKHAIGHGSAPWTVAPVFPEEYSTSRSLITNNPGSLLAGDDWQGMSVQSDVEGYVFAVSNGGFLGTDAATIGVVNGPAGAFRAELVSEPTFGQVVRCWQTDGSDGFSQTPRTTQSFTTGANKVWYRVLVKYETGFELDDGGAGQDSWKLVFGGHSRQTEIVDSDYRGGGWVNYGDGATNILPNSRHLTNLRYSEARSEWTSEQWIELIFYEEPLNLATGEYRGRRWVRLLTVGDSILRATPDIPNHNVTVTAIDTGTDTLTAAGHGFVEDQPVGLYDSGNGIPTGLSRFQDYFVVNPTGNTFQLSASAGGAVVDITSDVDFWVSPWRNGIAAETGSGGTSIPADDAGSVQLGINRNKSMDAGERQWWMWGPWECIDGEIIPDPYGLASDMV